MESYRFCFHRSKNMPSSINGIGTHYYGRRNQVRRLRACSHCQYLGAMDSYETRLWFVVVFVPVIPLRRLQILDECPQCRRHYALDLEEFEASRQLTASRVLAKYREQLTAEAAAEAHGTMLELFLRDEAQAFRETVLTQYPRDIPLRKQLAHQLHQTLDEHATQSLFKQVLALDPADTLARTQRARFLLRFPKRLEEAWQLTDFLREPGAGQIYDLSVLDLLSRQLEAAGQPERALELLEHLLAEFPEAGEQQEFRRRLSRLERRVGRPVTRLPQRSFSFRDLFDAGNGRYPSWLRWATFLGLAGLLLLAGLGVTNELFRRQRRLHILSSFAQPLQVTVDGDAIRTLRSQEPLWLPEGSHRVQVTAPVEREIVVEMRTPWWSRWTHSPVWVWNVAETSQLVRHDLYYARHPQQSHPRVITQETYFESHVDYPFVAPPRTISIKLSQQVHRVSLEALVPQPVDWLSNQAAKSDSSVLLTYAEGHLNANPRDELLLATYRALASNRGLERRAETFLKRGLWREPLSIEWHLEYAQLGAVCQSPEPLIQEYHERLIQSPGEARWLYLSANWQPPFDAGAGERLRQAHTADPQLGWPALDLSVRALSRGEWDEAQRWFRLAKAALPRRLAIFQTVHKLALATGDFSEETMLLDPIRRDPSAPEAFWLTIWLAESAARRGECDRVFRLLRELEGVSAQAEIYPTGPLLFADYYEELCGPREGLRTSASLADPEKALHQLLLRGDPAQLNALPPAAEASDAATPNWITAAAISLACDLAGLEQLGTTWREVTVGVLKKGDPRQRQAGLWLAQESPPTDEELAQFGGLPTEGSAVWHALMARRFPEQRTRHLDWVRRLNIGRLNPARLLDKLLAQP